MDNGYLNDHHSYIKNNHNNGKITPLTEKNGIFEKKYKKSLIFLLNPNSTLLNEKL